MSEGSVVPLGHSGAEHTGTETTLGEENTGTDPTEL